MLKSDCLQTDFYDLLLELVDPVLPEHDLQIAVLDRAIRDYKGSAIYTGARHYQARNIKLAMRDAQEWFVSQETDYYSFLGICDCLDIEPKLIIKKFLTNTKDISRWSTKKRSYD